MCASHLCNFAPCPRSHTTTRAHSYAQNAPRSPAAALSKAPTKSLPQNRLHTTTRTHAYAQNAPPSPAAALSEAAAAAAGKAAEFAKAKATAESAYGEYAMSKMQAFALDVSNTELEELLNPELVQVCCCGGWTYWVDVGM